jgi:hypothetical protein
MRKAGVLSILFVVVLLAITVIAEAQQTGKIFRMGFLDPSTASGIAGLLEAFRKELSKLGWIEGKNIAFEYRFAEQKSERLVELYRRGRSCRGRVGREPSAAGRECYRVNPNCSRAMG